MKEVLDEHYTRLADEYDSFLYYSPDFVRQLTEKMIEKLDLRPNDFFVDLCGGTGMYSLDIHKQVDFSGMTLCVDAYQEMLDKIPKDAPIEPVCMDALIFSGLNLRYDKVLIKEAVHHITQREQLFQNIFNQLSSGGRLLLVHVPPELDYPIFDRALEKAKTWHAKPQELVQHMEKAGFRVESDTVNYPHSIPKEHYFRQVESRFMTVLSSLSDDEMQNGLDEMRERYRELEVLEFIDRFDFITGMKP